MSAVRNVKMLTISLWRINLYLITQCPHGTSYRRTTAIRDIRNLHSRMIWDSWISIMQLVLGSSGMRINTARWSWRMGRHTEKYRPSSEWTRAAQENLIQDIEREESEIRSREISGSQGAPRISTATASSSRTVNIRRPRIISTSACILPWRIVSRCGVPKNKSCWWPGPPVDTSALRNIFRRYTVTEKRRALEKE